LNYMGKMTRPEVEKYLKHDDVVLVPVGSLEQHGRHIALDNDAFSAFHVAERVADRTGVLYTPVMPFGYSKHHLNFAGSVSLESQTLKNVYKEVCMSLLHHGFNKIVIMNGHGGNTPWIKQAQEELFHDTGVRVFSLMIFNMKGGFGSDALDVLSAQTGGHACEMETSFSMYLGQRVTMDEAVDWKEPSSWTDFTRKYMNKVTTSRLFDEVTEIGSKGYPTRADNEKGKAMVDAVVDEISEFVADLKDLDLQGGDAFFSNKA